MATLSDLVPRRAQSIVSEALEDTRVVLINGARQGSSRGTSSTPGSKPSRTVAGSKPSP